jgi:tripartite-type tricarboxylate transporter receptor subunit TctC
MQHVGRARLLALLAGVSLLVGACAPAAPSPTAAPTKLAESKPAATAAPAKATEAPAAKPAATTAPAKPAETKPAETKPVASPAAKAEAKPAASPAAKAEAKPAAKAEELPALTDAQKKAAEDFYRGKTITTIVGLSAGGGFDQMARLLARHMGKYIPGNPNIIVENRTGAGGLVALNYVYKAAPQDGSVMQVASEINLNNQILGQEGIEFDFARFQWLGSTQEATVVCYARKDANVSTLKDVIDRREPLIVGATEKGSNSYDFPAVLQQLMKANVKLVPGYPGSAQIRLAMESGEVQAHCVPWEAIKSTIGEWVNSGFVKVFVQQAPERHPELKDVGLAEEAAPGADDKQILRLVTISGAISKPFSVGPGVSADRVLALRHAFNQAMKDAAFLDDTQKQKVDLSPKSGPRVQQLIEEALKSDPKVVARLKELMK